MGLWELLAGARQRQNRHLKIFFMKKIILLLIGLSVMQNIFSQDSMKLLEFKGGYDTLLRKVYGNIVRYERERNISSEKKYSSYYTVAFKIKIDNSIDNTINIFMLNGSSDSKLDSVIIESIRQTQGKWINHSKTEETVVLPVYYLYKDRNENSEKIPDIMQSYYLNWKKRKVIYLKPIILWTGSAVR